ncbi:MAG: hypothetical protein J6U21_02655 [Bacteroidales bacterium]|nr:hypothetical protein [Bacteroidales bacterium]
MTTKFYKRFFALLTELGIVEERAAIISGFTNGRTDSSRDLSDLDAALLIKQIEKQYGVDRERDNCEKLRKRLIGMSYGCGKDAKFVIEWAENHGVKDKHGNLNKRLFNYYNTAELLTLIGVFTKVCKHYKEKENAKD